MKLFFKKEYELIVNLIDKLNPITNNLYVYGECKWANSLLINNFVNQIEQDSNIKILYINCAESGSLDSEFIPLYDEILYKLKTKKFNDKIISSKYPGDFFVQLNEILCTHKWYCVYIVLENFEKLKNFPPKNLNILANMNNYLDNQNLNCKLITIFNSLLSPEKLFGSYNNFELFSLFVPNPTQNDITEILLDEFNKNNKPKYYEFYVQQMLQTLYKICSNVSELTYIIKSSWKYFQNLLSDDEIYDEWELLNKWKILLKDSISLVYSRISPTANDMAPIKSIDFNSKCLQLPYYCRYLLIAGYIASFNNKSTDKDVFMMGKFHLSKRQKESKSKMMNAINSLSGPKQFSIDRLFAIYSFISEDLTEENYWSIEKLVENLVSTRFFVPIQSKSDPIKNCKYVCVASREFIFEIAKSLNVDMQRYLNNN